MFRTILTLSVLASLAACSDYDMVAQEGEELSEPNGMEPEVESVCQHDRSAYIDAEVVSLGEDAWVPGWNTIAQFTLTTDKDTCFDTTFSLDFTSTDDADTGWNHCEEYGDQDRFRVFTDDGGDALRELDANWEFQGATGDNGAYVHTCDPGRFIVDTMPVFVDEDTTLLAGNPLTFVIEMEAEGSTDPEERMKVDLVWDDSSQAGTNSGNLHQREGELLPFIE